MERSVAVVITILEAHVELDKAPVLLAAYQKGLGQLPPQMIQTFILQSFKDKTLWQIISVWKNRAALEEMRNSTETPEGILIFRSAGAEPQVSVFDVPAFAP